MVLNKVPRVESPGSILQTVFLSYKSSIVLKMQWTLWKSCLCEANFALYHFPRLLAVATWKVFAPFCSPRGNFQLGKNTQQVNGLMALHNCAEIPKPIRIHACQANRQIRIQIQLQIRRQIAIPNAAKVICEPNNSAPGRQASLGRRWEKKRERGGLTVKLIDRYVKHFVALDFAILSVNIRRWPGDINRCGAKHIALRRLWRWRGNYKRESEKESEWEWAASQVY